MKGNMKQAVKKAGKGGILLSAILALALTLLPAGQARAEEKGSLAVTLAEKADELQKAGLVLDIYQVASAQWLEGFDTYKFVETEAFSELAEDVRKPDVNNDDWRSTALKAAQIVKRDGLTPAEGLSGKKPMFDEKDAPIALPADGLYLVIARGTLPGGQTSYFEESSDDGSLVTTAYSPGLRFEFTPQLVAVPGKPQYDSNNTADPESWMYKVPMTLKVGWGDREAALRIVKSLDTYETKDPATFIFKVEGKLGDKKVYSNVVSLAFDGPGTKSYPITGLPVDTEVTVTEVYSGANYKVTAKPEVNPQVLEAEKISVFDFSNTYNDTYHGGGSVVNTFTKKTSDAGNHYYDTKDMDDKAGQVKDDQQLEAEKAAQ